MGTRRGMAAIPFSSHTTRYCGWKKSIFQLVDDLSHYPIIVPCFILTISYQLVQDFATIHSTITSHYIPLHDMTWNDTKSRTITWHNIMNVTKTKIHQVTWNITVCNLERLVVCFFVFVLADRKMPQFLSLRAAKVKDVPFWRTHGAGLMGLMLQETDMERSMLYRPTVYLCTNEGCSTLV